MNILVYVDNTEAIKLSVLLGGGVLSFVLILICNYIEMYFGITGMSHVGVIHVNLFLLKHFTLI